MVHTPQSAGNRAESLTSFRISQLYLILAIHPGTPKTAGVLSSTHIYLRSNRLASYFLGINKKKRIFECILMYFFCIFKGWIQTCRFQKLGLYPDPWRNLRVRSPGKCWPESRQRGGNIPPGWRAGWRTRRSRSRRPAFCTANSGTESGSSGLRTETKITVKQGQIQRDEYSLTEKEINIKHTTGKRKKVDS